MEIPNFLAKRAICIVLNTARSNCPRVLVPPHEVAGISSNLGSNLVEERRSESAFTLLRRFPLAVRDVGEDEKGRYRFVLGSSFLSWEHMPKDGGESNSSLGFAEAASFHGEVKVVFQVLCFMEHFFRESAFIFPM